MFEAQKVVYYSKKLNSGLFKILKLPLKSPHLPHGGSDTVNLLYKTLVFIRCFSQLDPKGP